MLNPQIIRFFFKLNDTELNKQLRWIAFYHLQSFNYQPRARRQKFMQVHTKNKKRKEYLKKVYKAFHGCSQQLGNSGKRSGWIY